ncbi:Transmembrane protein [Hirschfeldia incana]|nr:Transmembrane protein [Hirschfeldia incana]
MGSIPFIFIILLFHLQKSKSQTIQSAHLLDLMIRDYTIRNFNIHVKTGAIQKIHLPANFSSIDIDTAKFRCGSLKRHGTRIGEFHFGPGLNVQPCVERVILVRQNLGFNWSSSIYSTGYNLTGFNYQLVTPVLGLLAYNSNPDGVAVNPYEVNLMGTEQNPILIDFLSVKSSGNPSSVNSSLLCASFTSNGSITFKEQVSAYVCLGTTQGHYALVVRDNDGAGGVIKPPSSPTVNDGRGGKLSRWKVAVGSVIGSLIGALLLGLLVVAMLVKGKKKAMREEIEQRAYEEEALQVSMVGHVRANPNNRYSNK